MEQMKLELENIVVNDIQWGESTTVKEGVLYVCKEEAINALKDPAFRNIELDFARPGESVRIIPVKDAIEPRVKVENGEFFPGFLGGFDKTGRGKTKVLKGSCVITAGSIVCYQEGIIDMSGPASEFIPFSKTNNIVIVAEVNDDVLPDEHETAIRLAGIKLAHYLAKSCIDVEADYTETYELEPVKTKLPKVAYANLLLAQGLLHDNYLYGLDAKGIQTTLLHPNELLDGAVVSGNCVTASDKNTTYDQENNPIINELFKRHGKDLDFCGVIASPISTVLAGKERSAASVANLCSMLDIDAIIVSEEGGGNPEADIMMIAEAVEKVGTKAVLLLHETAGERGDTEPLVNSTPVADAVVTAGNKHEYVKLPKMDKVIGNLDTLEILAGYGNKERYEDGSIEVRTAVIIDAISNLGSGKRTGITY